MRSRFFKASLVILFVASLAVAAIVHLPPLMAAQPSDEAQYRRMRVFTEVLAEIQRKYVEDKPIEELITAAVKGMVQSLDPHSSYLTPEEYNELKVETKGSFFGVGIEITLKDNILTVVSPIEGTPADLAGVKAGDRIIKINGKLTKGMSLMDAVKVIRGPKGSKVTLTVLRESTGKLKDIAIVRDLIPVHSVRYYLMDEGYGYIRVANFQEDTTQDLVKALRTLQTQKTHLKGLVLDLRNDPGGLLQEAIGVADQFLDDGVIVSTKGRQPNQEMVFRASKTMTADKYPIICLVNNGSASASEIVAGALQDHKRAVIMGTTSFGKGSVQTIIPLDDKGALRLTTARYYTPNGRAIQAKGIVPDVNVPFEPVNSDKQERPRVQGIREKDLTRAMPAEPDNGSGETKAAPKPEDKKNQDKLKMPPDRLTRDNQLRRALDLLKAWEVFERVASKPPTVEARSANR